jgi:O-antigen/teichoic acid export membrane protein
MLSYLKKIATKALKEGTPILVANLISAIGTFGGIKLLIGLLSAQEYGALALAVSIQSGISLLIFGPISQAGVRHASSWLKQEQSTQFLQALTRLVTEGAICTVLLIAVVGLYLKRIESIQATAWYVGIAIYSITSGITLVSGQLLNGTRKRVGYSILYTLDSILKYPIAYCCILAMTSSAFATFLGYILSSSAVAGLSLLMLRAIVSSIKKNVQYQANSFREATFAIAHRLRAYSLSFAVWGAAQGLYLASDKWIIAKFYSLKELGFYTLGYQLGFTPVAIISGITIQVIQPLLYNSQENHVLSRPSKKNQDKLKTAQLLIYGISLILLGYVFWTTLGHYLVPRITGYKFLQSLDYLNIFAASACIFGIGELIACNFYNKETLSIVKTIKIIVSALGIVLNILAGMASNVQYLAAASLATNTLYLFLLLFFLKLEGCKTNQHVSSADH